MSRKRASSSVALGAVSGGLALAAYILALRPRILSWGF